MPQQPDAPSFTLHVDHNRYLPIGGTEVHAIVSVESHGGGAVAGVAPEAAEVIIIDTSGSMMGSDIAAAKRAARAAIDTLRDGVRFAIVAGTDRARMIYPNTRELAEVSPHTREQAKTAVGRIDAYGGTAMGEWLLLANRLFAAHPNAIKHAILLTDGQNNQPADVLSQVIAECSGTFVCDGRGVGAGWNVEEVRRITDALLGTVGLVAEADEMEADFRSMTEAAMGKAVADVMLRLWVPQSATVNFVKQVAPTVADLTEKRVETGPQVGDYPTGAWGDEVREYHVAIEVPPGDAGREMRAGWVRLVVPGPEDRVVASGNVLAEWTHDEAASTRIHPRVAHYTGQEELAAAIQEGVRAMESGDEDTATARLGRAVQLAHQSGHADATTRLGGVVDVVDAGTGTVRLKKDASRLDQMRLDADSVRTVRTGARPDSPTG